MSLRPMRFARVDVSVCNAHPRPKRFARVQKMFSRSTDDIPDGYRRRTRQELEKLYENKASVRHGSANFFGLRPEFAGMRG